ncbi:hypothetical protein LEP1GSC018_3351 [Leptospira kirschneri str. 2008720114]|nr:hypothetical protein LEP1GSC018_3351 [Leptospira kirschneri str. 2008720114]
MSEHLNNVLFYPSDSKIFFQLVGLVMASYESRWKLSTTLS